MKIILTEKQIKELNNEISRTKTNNSIIEEISFIKGWINDAELEKLAAPLFNNQYGQYLQRVLNAKRNQ